MPQETMYQKLLRHNLYPMLEEELTDMDIEGDFLREPNVADSVQRLISALDTLETELGRLQTESQAAAEEEVEEEEDDEELKEEKDDEGDED